MALVIGDVIDGKYSITRLLGEGGMGAVYEGENTRIHRKVAIKVLHGDVASNEEAMMRFEREAQAAGRIGSEHIVEVLDLGDLPGGERYMVMEFLDGEALSDRISRGRMDPRKIAQLMVDMLEGLKAAHAANIVHRDLKPDNVFLTHRSGKDDFVKIVDFGISKFNSLGGEFSMTRTGAVMGTPYYMAPEQAKGGKTVDHRVDLYAVGIILYQAVVGNVPFQAETFNELLFKIVLETPPPLEDQVEGIDPDFVNLVNRGMAREPEDRYQTAEEFQQALRTWLNGGRIPAATMIAGTPRQTGPTSAGELPMQTPGAWSAEEDQVSVPVKKAFPVVWVGAAAVAAVGVAAFLILSPAEQEVVPAAETAEVNAVAADQKAKSERDAEMKALVEEKVAAEKGREEALAAKAKAEEEQKALEANAKEEADKKATAKAAASARPTPAPQAKPKAAAPVPTPAPAPAPAPAPGPSGRPIRTSF